MILLDTNAILWLLAEHPRATSLLDREDLHISPVAILELKYLVESGRIQVVEGGSVRDIAEDSRWRLDNPSSEDLFEAALDLEWTRDPFDRLLTAHASLRGWRLATGDRHLKANIAASGVLPL